MLRRRERGKTERTQVTFGATRQGRLCRRKEKTPDLFHIALSRTYRHRHAVTGDAGNAAREARLREDPATQQQRASPSLLAAQSTRMHRAPGASSHCNRCSLAASVVDVVRRPSSAVKRKRQETPSPRAQCSW